jgi:hypothetical protein
MTDVKRNVYNGYTEYFFSGIEIKEYFKNCYECFGRHHEKISSYKINFNKHYSQIKDDVVYRLFINEYFCKIMDGETDKDIVFFGYTKEKPKWAKD